MLTDVFGEIGFLGMLTASSGLQGLILATFLLVRQNDNIKAARWVALMIFLMSLHLLDMTFSKTQLVQYFAPISSSSFFFLFLIGPLYFFHVRSLLDPEMALNWNDCLHVIPALYILYEMLPWLSAPADLKIALQQQPIRDIPLDLYMKLAFNIIQVASYLAYSKHLIQTVRQSEANYSADTEINQSIRLLEHFTQAFISWTVLYFIVFLTLSIWGGYGESIDHVWLFISGLFIQFIGIAAVIRPTLFSQRLANAVQQNCPDAPALGPDKYERSALSQEDKQQLRLSFEAYMVAKKPFLDNELRMPAVAQALNTTTHYLSQMINQEIGDSFLRIINSYRINEVIRLMNESGSSAKTILELAFTAGFNSKNSFNRAFKDATNMTPTAYKEQIRKAAK